MKNYDKKSSPQISYLLVLDFETTCENNVRLEPCNEIIEFPCMILNTQTLKIEGKFHQYVKPRFNPVLTIFCTKLTGITQQMVDKGKHIEDVLEDFYKWIGQSEFLKEGNFAFVTCGDWDLNKCLKFEAKVKKLNVPKYMKSYINIKDYCGKVLKLKENPRGMMQMLDILNIKHEGKHHSGIDDVKNIVNICTELIKTFNATFPKDEIIGQLQKNNVYVGKAEYKEKFIEQKSKAYVGKAEYKDKNQIRYLLVLDFETTCENNVRLEPCNEIIEFPCMILNTQTLKIEGKFHQYVKPRFNPVLTIFCTKLTGITQQMVDKGKHIEDVLEDFYKWIGQSEFLKEGNFAFVTCGDWDLNKCLKFEAKVKKLNIPKYMKSYINIKDYCGKVLKLKENPRGMMQMLDILNIKHEGKHHSGIDDVKNIVNICADLVKTAKADFSKAEIEKVFY